MTVEEFLNAIPELGGRVLGSEPSGSLPILHGQLFVLVTHSNFNDAVKLYGGMSLKSKLIDIEIRLAWDGVTVPPNDTAIWEFMPKIEAIHHAINEDRSGKKVVEVDLEVEGQPQYDPSTKSFVSTTRLRVWAESV
jgi:hypothetical protein